MYKGNNFGLSIGQVGLKLDQKSMKTIRALNLEKYIPSDTSRTIRNESKEAIEASVAQIKREHKQLVKCLHEYTPDNPLTEIRALKALKTFSGGYITDNKYNTHTLSKRDNTALKAVNTRILQLEELTKVEATPISNKPPKCWNPLKVYDFKGGLAFRVSYGFDYKARRGITALGLSGILPLTVTRIAMADDIDTLEARAIRLHHELIDIAKMLRCYKEVKASPEKWVQLLRRIYNYSGGIVTQNAYYSITERKDVKRKKRLAKEKLFKLVLSLRENLGYTSDLKPTPKAILSNGYTAPVAVFKRVEEPADPEVEEEEEQTADELTRSPSLDEMNEYMWDKRGVDVPCEECGGSGMLKYSSTSTWRRGIGSLMDKDDVCDRCWGTGDAHRIGVDLRATDMELIHLRYLVALYEKK